MFTGRREDDRLVTGAGRYAADWNLPGQLHAAFLRSDRAHAEIVRLDVSAARAFPGVAAVLTGVDTAAAAFGSAPPLLRVPGRDGKLLRVPHRNVLAWDRVRHVGEEIALVVTATPGAAQDAVEKIEIDYRELPVIVRAQDALREGAPQLHADVPGNLCFDFEYGDEAATAKAFAQAAHVTRLVLEAERIAGNPMEPKACLASHDPFTGDYDLYAPTQGLSIMRGGLAGITGIPAEKLRVHALDVGGAFGVRSEAYTEYCALLLAARMLGRPVKWIASRSECLLSDHHGRAATLTGELALDRDGRFLALRIEWLVNCGAYLSQPGPLINSVTPAQHAINAYAIPALYGRHRLALTNTTPTTAYRGAGRPNVSYLVERLVDAAARETGADRIELRRRNFIARDAFPYKTPTGSVYDSGDPAAQLDEALLRSNWNSFEDRRRESSKRGRLRGIGCAAFIEPSGGGVNPEQVAIRLDGSGSVTLYALAGPSGQGHETVFPEMVATVFGIPAERIRLRASDPAGPALSGEGTIGSRSVIAHGGALAAAAHTVVRKGTELAAKALEVASTDLEFQAGRYTVKGTDLGVSLENLRFEIVEGIMPARTFPGGVHITEVELDPETGTVELIAYTAVDDCGRAISPILVEGQIHGGVVQGIGQVMGEQCAYELQSGQLLSGSFMDYAMPRADEQPHMQLFDKSVASPTNALGVKGAGEAGAVGAVPALANAIMHALEPLGIHRMDLPYTSYRIWRAIEER